MLHRHRPRGDIDTVKFAVAAPPHAKVHVTAVDAVTAGAGRFVAVLRVKQGDVNRAARALSA